MEGAVLLGACGLPLVDKVSECPPAGINPSHCKSGVNNTASEKCSSSGVSNS